jgi:hypothetical protein
MQVTIPAELEPKLEEIARLAGFTSIQDYVVDLVQFEVSEAPRRRLPHEEWLEKFDAFVSKQVSHNTYFDDSRSMLTVNQQA